MKRKAIQEEGQEGCSSWGHTQEERLEDEQDEHSNAEEYTLNPDTCSSSNYGHSFSEVKKSVTQKKLVKHFRCIKVNCPSIIIVYEDPDKDNKNDRNDYLFNVKECKYHQ